MRTKGRQRKGKAVTLEIADGALVVRPKRKRYALDELVEQAKHCTVPDALDVSPVGAEVL